MKPNTNYIQHTVNTGSKVHFIKEYRNIFDVPVFPAGSIQLHGQANTITEFVKMLDIENQWIPYGYTIFYIHRNENSKNMTAFIRQYPVENPSDDKC